MRDHSPYIELFQGLGIRLDRSRAHSKESPHSGPLAFTNILKHLRLLNLGHKRPRQPGAILKPCRTFLHSAKNCMVPRPPQISSRGGNFRNFSIKIVKFFQKSKLNTLFAWHKAIERAIR